MSLWPRLPRHTVKTKTKDGSALCAPERLHDWLIYSAEILMNVLFANSPKNLIHHFQNQSDVQDFIL